MPLITLHSIVVIKLYDLFRMISQNVLTCPCAGGFLSAPSSPGMMFFMYQSNDLQFNRLRNAFCDVTSPMSIFLSSIVLRLSVSCCFYGTK